jgi:hypothetical protein
VPLLIVCAFQLLVSSPLPFFFALLVSHYLPAPSCFLAGALVDKAWFKGQLNVVVTDL